MSKTVNLSEPIKGPGGKQITAITLREPKYRDYMELDLPVIYVRLKTAAAFSKRRRARCASGSSASPIAIRTSWSGSA